MKKQISKSGYLRLCWICIVLGIGGNALFSTLGIFNGFDYYTAVYMGLSLMVLGFGVGLSVAHAFKIRGLE